MNRHIDSKNVASNYMTAKKAIKSRCLDCNGWKCTDERCFLYGLNKPKRGVNRTTAIRQYCQWCTGGNSISQCSCPECAIYQYRAQSGVGAFVDFEAQKPMTGYVSGTAKQKDDLGHAWSDMAPKNVCNMGVT